MCALASLPGLCVCVWVCVCVCLSVCMCALPSLHGLCGAICFNGIQDFIVSFVLHAQMRYGRTQRLSLGICAQLLSAEVNKIQKYFPSACLSVCRGYVFWMMHSACLSVCRGYVAKGFFCRHSGEPAVSGTDKPAWNCASSLCPVMISEKRQQNLGGFQWSYHHQLHGITPPLAVQCLGEMIILHCLTRHDKESNR